MSVAQHRKGQNLCFRYRLRNAKGELDKITEAFYRVDKSRSRKQGGVGLGLALCKEIVRIHKGDMEFISQEEKGTTAIITIGGGHYEKTD